MQISQPVDEIFFSQGIPCLYEDSEDQLISMAAKIPNLQYQSNHLLEKPQEADRAEIEKLAYCANALDFELSTWANNIPISWSYTVALSVSNPASPKFAPCVLHRYPDFYIARVWDFYRVARLIV